MAAAVLLLALLPVAYVGVSVIIVGRSSFSRSDEEAAAGADVPVVYVGVSAIGLSAAPVGASEIGSLSAAKPFAGASVTCVGGVPSLPTSDEDEAGAPSGSIRLSPPRAETAARALSGGGAPYAPRAPLLLEGELGGDGLFAMTPPPPDDGHPSPPAKATFAPKSVWHSVRSFLTSTRNFSPSACAISMTSGEHKHPAASVGASSASTESMASQHRWDARTPPRPAHGRSASLNFDASHASGGGGVHAPPICLLVDVNTY